MERGTLRTLLGSCVGLALYDRRLRVAGLAHIVMPRARGRQRADGKLVDTLGRGRFLGATAFLRRGTTFAAPVTVTAIEPTRAITWPSDKLDTQFANNIDLQVAIEACLGLELSRFLQTARAQVQHPPLT